jgi:hypothetical protein
MKATRVLAALTLIGVTGVALTAQPERPLVDAMRAIYWHADLHGVRLD